MTAPALQGRTWRVERRLSGAHPALPGHFPGQPVFPGVVLLAEVLEAAWTIDELAPLLRQAPVIDNVKFLSAIVPEAGCETPIEVLLSQRSGGVDFELHCRGQLSVRGQWRAVAAP
ncbi:hypothetical protein [Ideonella sp.]|uniref:hypothetical protein n=1 Tax=Ideonella sp. TaxID=1929293 RepID=UPI002B499E20|nr:hypothetical protein [Ideonella sp.]HJV72173.1 hypothetical protein [Ideonella sp.]